MTVSAGVVLSYAERPMDEELDLESPAWKQLLRTLGARPSRSAEAARERELAEIRAMSAAARIGLALRLGRRARALREGFLKGKREP